MISFLKNHPFSVESFFESSLVLTFAVLKEELRHLIPECLQLETFKDKWAFIAMAMVQTKRLRPRGFPKFLGNDFFLIGYRVFVTFVSSNGKKYRGLYILKSETNKKKMKFFGNLFTHYNYSITDIKNTVIDSHRQIESIKSGFRIVVNETSDIIPLPKESPFEDWKEARKFAGPLPFTFTYNAKNNKVLIIQGVRQNWKPRPIAVADYKISFIENLNLRNIVLANAFIIKDIPYYWKKGRFETWKN